jgi:hypothetical protein
VAELLAPSAVLPRRISLVGIHEFCQGLQHIAREHQAAAFARFDELVKRFEDPKYYWILPPQGRVVYASACHFARGAFAMMRADGTAALESAEALDRSGMTLYEMIGSQLRYLYYLNRGELASAQAQRERVEVHAARAGSAWQVELWEPAALLPFYLATDDVVELSRIAHRLAELAESVPSMWRYRELSEMAAQIHARKPSTGQRFSKQLGAVVPRSFIGWSTALAGLAMFFNSRGEFAEAREMVERALTSMTDADRQYTMIFLLVDLQAACAEAGLGRADEGVRRLEHLLALHAPSENALVLGLVHEMRARIAFAAGMYGAYQESTREAARWLRPTGTPTLVARCERLEQLGVPGASVPRGDLVALSGYIATGMSTNDNTRIDRRSPSSDVERSKLGS